MFLLPLLLACVPTDKETGGPVDADGDGATTEVDCDDTDAALHPGATETCDGVDQDCDGVVDDEASDASTWYTDADGDTHGDAATPVTACTQPATAVESADDCDDNDATVFPGADELCNAHDDDCDGETDEDAVDLGTWYADEDGDTHGDAAFPTTACDAPPGSSETSDDCDDTDASVFPGADEHCNGTDDDCDGETDEDAVDPVTWYADTDGDGHGDAADPVAACEAPPGTSATADDCDDTRTDVHPGAPEVCDGVDDDCDGSTDEADAADVTIFFADTDGDGAGDRDLWVVACDAPPGFVESSDDCDDTDATAFPGAPETCDGVDDDCDGDTDEDAVDAPAWYTDGDADGAGLDGTEVYTCAAPAGMVPTGGDCDDTDADRSPLVAEVCNEIDDDCDGVTDDSAVDALTWYNDADGDGYGDIESVRCSPPPGSVATGGDCDDAAATVYPGAEEHCDGVDEDCDGTPDEDAVDAPSWYTDADGDGYGDRDTPTVTCSAPYGTVATGGDCADADPTVSPAAAEVCGDGIDNNCDDSAGSCALSGDVEAGAANAVVAYTGANAYFATSVSAGDVNDDGADELLVYAGNVGNGALYVFEAPTGAMTDEDALTHLDSSGYVSVLGRDSVVHDLTGDGVGDLLVGAPYDSTAGYSRGAVYVWEGPVDATDTLATADFSLVGNADSAKIGGRLEVGELTGDGIPDVFVGSWYGNRAAIFAGPVSASGASPWATFTDNSAGMAASLGDLDGDGVDDVVAGFGEYSNTNNKIYVHYGVGAGTVDLSSTADVTLQETYGSTAYVGYDVVADADLDGDGRADLAVGAPWTGSPTRSGTVYVLTGVGPGGTRYLDTTYDYALRGTATYQYLGQSLAHADLDGDGREDLVAGAPGGSGATPSVAVYYSLDHATPDFTMSHSAGGFLGGDVATGDFDGDGYPDLASGDYGVDDGSTYYAAGAAYVMYGSGL